MVDPESSKQHQRGAERGAPSQRGPETERDETVLHRLAALAQAVGTARDLTGVYRALLDFTLSVVPTNGLFVSLYDEERAQRTCVYAWSEGEEHDVSHLPPLPMSDSPNSRSVATNQIIVTDDLQVALVGQPRVDLGLDVDPAQPQSSLAVPMAVLGRVIGGFEVQSVRRAAYRPEHVTAMWMAANLAAIATENVRLLARERDLRSTAEASEQRYRDLAEGLDAVVYEAEPETRRFSFVTRQAERILGYPTEDWLREPAFLLRHIHPEDVEAATAAYRTAAQSGRRAEVEYRALAADGRLVWLRDVQVVTRDPVTGGARARGVLMDISEQKHLEAEWLHGQKMDSIGRLAGSIAHDFNNLLTAISGYTELVLAELGAGHPIRDDVEQIQRAAARASALTAQLLAFSRRQVLQPKVVDVNQSIGALEPLLRRLIGENVTVSTHLAPDLGHARVDPYQLDQVIINLALNARDAMPEGGSLVIRTANEDLEDRAGDESGIRSMRPHAMIEIADTGVGIDEETISKIFEPFFTTKERGRGTGLGLATVYGIVRQSGGDVRVVSAPGAGSVFRVYLPRADEPVEPAPERLASGDRVDGSETILVAEDEDAVRGLISTVLREHGYAVLEASDATSAMELASDLGSRVDMLLTDIAMPGRTGPELAEALSESRPGLKVLYVSGYAEDSEVRQRFVDRELSFLEKPFTVERLLTSVRSVLDREIRESPAR